MEINESPEPTTDLAQEVVEMVESETQESTQESAKTEEEDGQNMRRQPRQLLSSNWQKSHLLWQRTSNRFRQMIPQATASAFTQEYERENWDDEQRQRADYRDSEDGGRQQYFIQSKEGLEKVEFEILKSE
jgi:hypothetical protein